MNGFSIWGGQKVEALVVDPGEVPDRIVTVLESASLRCAAVVKTRGHFEHVGAIARNIRGKTLQVYIRNPLPSRPIGIAPAVERRSCAPASA
jgi:glyoxylase-like metal-dependent hydrolase (beta-lactamase superfamily II)